MTVKIKQFCYNLILQGYMFRLLRVIIRPSNELTQDYLIPSALCVSRSAYNGWCASGITPPIVSATGSLSALGIR